MTKTYEEMVALVRDTLVDAGSTFRPDKKEAMVSLVMDFLSHHGDPHLGDPHHDDEARNEQ